MYGFGRTGWVKITSLIFFSVCNGFVHLAAQQPDNVEKARFSDEARTSSLIVGFQNKLDGRWSLNLKTDQPVSAIRFPLDYPNLPWSTVSDGFELVERDHFLEVSRSDRESFQNVDLAVAPRFQQAVRDYEPVWEFSDDAIMVYTGQFPRDVVLPSGKCEEARREFRFSSEQNQNMVLDGVVYELTQSDRQIEWSADDRDTYVYFGKGGIVESDVYVGLLDPALPKWIKKRLKSFAPQLTNFYTQGIGKALPYRPMIMFSFDGKEKNRRNFTGGTLPGLVQLNLTGEGWLDHSIESEVSFCHFLAHEFSHLWNSKLIRPEKGVPGWMHEGAAEMMAYNALLQLGIIDRHEYRSKLQQAVDRFVKNCQGISLNESMKHGQPKNFYDGGIVIGLVVQQAALKDDPAHDFLSFWKKMTARVLESERRYTIQDYCDAVDEFIDNDQVSQWLSRFPTTELSDPAKELHDIFELLDLGSQVKSGIRIDPIMPKTVSLGISK